MKHSEVCVVNAYGITVKKMCASERRRARMPENGAESETAVLLPPLANERRSEECWTAKWRGGSPKRNAGNHN